MSNLIRVTVWNEYRHEKLENHVAKIYPHGIHSAIGEMLLSQASALKHTVKMTNWK